MSNKTIIAAKPQNQEQLTTVFQKFNGVFLAKISNLKDKKTFAYGENKAIAEANAVKNFKIKYPFHIFYGLNN